MNIGGVKGVGNESSLYHRCEAVQIKAETRGNLYLHADDAGLVGRSTSASSSAISASTSRTLFSRAVWVTYEIHLAALLPRCTTEYTLTLCFANNAGHRGQHAGAVGHLKRM